MMRNGEREGKREKKKKRWALRGRWGWQQAVGGKEGEGTREGKKDRKSRVLDRSNMAGSHSYFSFTLLCIRTWFQKVPKPQGSLPANTVCQFFKTCHSLSVYQLALHKRGLLLVLLQLLLSLCLCTANTWGSGGGVHFLPQCITLGSNLIVGGTQGACVFFRGGAMGFSPPFHLRFDSTQYPCGVFESELKNHTNAWKYERYK